ncbi:hypothetical protein GCM10027435_17980 [Haloparvum alkalitolerans]|uniref:NUMOD3 domain-containing DNA-binding protein n=1 Tax=Haloparvum TaxID=1820337 RepID=UPI00071E6F3B|nr:NUMOD3 domain-containing DNA-binding protein [Haloparvum sedimenti]
MAKRYRSGWWLELKYHREGWTQAEIADECGVSARTVRKWMERRGIETRDLVGEDHPLYGTSRDDDVRRRIAETMAGREFSEDERKRLAEGQRGRTLTRSTREKIGEALSGRQLPESTRQKMSESRSGRSNPMWRGGGTLRYGPGWTRARREARSRTSACANCGHDGDEYRLEVHHIVPVRLFDRSDTHQLSDAHVQGNLVVLCKRCHARAEHGDLSFEPSLETDIPEGYDELN